MFNVGRSMFDVHLLIQAQMAYEQLQNNLVLRRQVPDGGRINLVIIGILLINHAAAMGMA